MLKDTAKMILFAKATVDILKEKLESKAADLMLQLQNFKNGTQNNNDSTSRPQCKLKEKAKEELLNLLSEINHKTHINEVQIKGFIKDKLIELTNNALLDSQELNDMRSEIAALYAEISDLKSQMKLTKKN